MLLDTTLQGQSVASRWLILGATLVVATAVMSYGFQAAARRFARLPSQWLQALSDAVLLIGGFGCLVGASFLILSLTPALTSQKYPLRASGGILFRDLHSSFSCVSAGLARTFPRQRHRGLFETLQRSRFLLKNRQRSWRGPLDELPVA